jgi:putative membrane protein
MSDPRVFFAAERTLLAWVRTGLTVIALGFVVARFGLFLRIMAQGAVGPPGPRYASVAIGVSLILLGSGAIAGALYNHRAYVRSLPSEDVPRLPLPGMGSLVAAALVVCGLLLAGYVALS